MPLVQMVSLEDGPFLNFLEWHNYRLSQEQKVFAERAENYKARFAGMVEARVKAGALPEAAIAQLPRLQQASVFQDDGFSTWLEKRAGHMRSTSGGDVEVLIAPGADEHVRDHEFAHVLGFSPNVRGTGQRLIHILGDSGGAALMNEAVTEHFTAIIGGAEPRLDADFAQRDDHVAYYHELELLHALCNAGRQRIDERLFIAAQVTSSAHEGQISAVGAQLHAELVGAFPGMDLVAELRSMGPNRELARPHMKELTKKVLQWNSRSRRISRLIGAIVSS